MRCFLNLGEQEAAMTTELRITGVGGLEQLVIRLSPKIKEMIERAADNALRSVMLPRAEVNTFAQLMERELRENDHRGGWGEASPQQLMNMVWGDVQKLDSALERGDLVKAREQAADVANGCMMLLDVLGLLLPPAGKEGGDGNDQ